MAIYASIDGPADGRRDKRLARDEIINLARPGAFGASLRSQYTFDWPLECLPVVAWRMSCLFIMHSNINVQNKFGLAVQYMAL